MVEIKPGKPPEYTSKHIYAIIVVSLFVLTTLSYQLYQSKRNEEVLSKKINVVANDNMESYQAFQKIQKIKKNEESILNAQTENEALRKELSEKYHITVE